MKIPPIGGEKHQPGSDPIRSAIVANRALFVSAIGFSAVMSVLALTTSLYMLQVYDRVLSSRSTDTLLLLTIIAFAAIVVFALLDSLRQRLLARLGMRVADMLAPPVLRAMVAMTSQSGGLSARSGLRDVETIRNFIASPVFAALLDAPFIVVYLIVLLLLSVWFLVLVLIGGGVLILLAIMDQRAINQPLTQSMAYSSKAHAFAEDGMRNADVLEGMGMSSAFVSRWRRQWLEGLRTGSEAADGGSIFSAASRGVRLLMQILLLGVGALLILDFQATGGIMIGASVIGARALAPIDALVSAWKSMIAVRLSRDRLVALLERAPRREEGMPLPRPEGRIQAIGVSYRAPVSAKTVLASISFELTQGQSVGIIGPSGSGKSTLLRLLTGAWPCTAGVVRLDGADIHTWPRRELAPHIGYLPQDVELFAGTVRENIARMSEGEPEMVVAGAKRAGAHEMILSLPKGYETEVGDNGHALSGGQSQLIGLARALYGDPRLVVLDEPNSNLDAASEEGLVSTLADLKAQGTTVIVVAHRPSILAGVDMMLVLRANGTIEAFGPRPEVMQQFTRRGSRSPANVVPLTPSAGPSGGQS